MNWKQISIETTEDAADIVSSVLMDAGATGVEVEGGSVPVAERDEYIAQPVDNDDAVIVKAYYGEDGFENTLAFVQNRINELKDRQEMGSLSLTVNTVVDTDWNENFKKHFKAFRAAGCFIVKPTWQDYPSQEGDIVIEIDPGMAFGSGAHETTRMCLELLQKHMPNKAAVLDVGCGSGILGIGAAKLGAKRVLALDNDSVSVSVASANAESNGALVMEVRQSDLLQNAGTDKYDIILANIIADIVIRLNQSAGEYLKENGVYIMSGIIDDREDDVKCSLESHGFEIIETLNMADWRAFAARKR
jgi:ribosomal protein L11 methyltransferase